MSNTANFTGRSRRRSTRWTVRLADVLSHWIITVGGIGTIVSVMTVFLFLVWVAAPLFFPATIEGRRRFAGQVPDSAFVHLATDESNAMAYTLDRDAMLRAYRFDTGALLRTEPLLGQASPSAWTFSVSGDKVAVGFADGTIRLGSIRFGVRFLDPNEATDELRNLPVGESAVYRDGVARRTPEGQLRLQTLGADFEAPLSGFGSSPIQRIDRSTTPDGRDVIATLAQDGRLRMTWVRRGGGRLSIRKGKPTVVGVDVPYEPLSDAGAPSHLMLDGLGADLYLIWPDGRLLRFDVRDRRTPRLAESLDVLEASDAKVTAVSFLIGKTTLMIGDSSGGLRGWFTARSDAAGSSAAPRLVAGHDLPWTDAAVTALAPSQRSRLIAAGYADGTVSVFHVTSDHLLVSASTGSSTAVAAIALTPRDDGLIAYSDSRLHAWLFDARYPEANLASLFRPVWYEGRPAPEHTWQSSSGADAFEPKFGMAPLIFGTLKATLYSMFFGAPLALLAAIYTSEFLRPAVKSRIKPIIELMASLPSVVLGFLAALVFAPYFQLIVPATLASFFTVPLAFLIGAYVWQILPQGLALRWADRRFLFICLVLPMGFLLAAWSGPVVERLLFGADLLRWLDDRSFGSGAGGWLLLILPICAALVAVAMGRFVNPWIRDFSADWSRSSCGLLDLFRFVAGAGACVLFAGAISWTLTEFGFDPRGSYIGPYDQRNALIVGFVMGFAIIPIIYTLAEDALSAVPTHLRSASLGAGATPWQTAVRIVIPTATSGLFSALMIGLGRAVGETMIVLMATGNTAIVDWNIFNGFRTLSANIAVEMPEAVRNSAHYRILFLAALVLFLITFLLNTAAEIVRLRFRRRAVEL